jgi:hypothetical protein
VWGLHPRAAVDYIGHDGTKGSIRMGACCDGGHERPGESMSDAGHTDTCTSDRRKKDGAESRSAMTPMVGGHNSGVVEI